MSASVRTVIVGGMPYLQVVRYLKAHDNKQKIEVIGSFGRDNLENRLKAEQFAASYNKLRDVASDFRQQNTRQSELVPSALAIFGVILGAALIVKLISEIFRDE